MKTVRPQADRASQPGQFYDRLCVAAATRGLRCRGGFIVGPGDALPGIAGGPARTVVLLGFTGPEHWPIFTASPESADGQANPLDRWSSRVIRDLAAEFGARPLHPFDGPPWWPFQRWAQRAEALHPSPLGILIHPRYGLWHAYRGALSFAAEFELPPPVQGPSPCSSCTATPCIAACPAGAVTALGFDRAACAAHVASPKGIACRSGCLARASCPVGVQYRYGSEQAIFHMQQLTLP